MAMLSLTKYASYATLTLAIATASINYLIFIQIRACRCISDVTYWYPIDFGDILVRGPSAPARRLFAEMLKAFPISPSKFTPPEDGTVS